MGKQAKELTIKKELDIQTCCLGIALLTAVLLTTFTTAFIVSLSEFLLIVVTILWGLQIPWIGLGYGIKYIPYALHDSTTIVFAIVLGVTLHALQLGFFYGLILEILGVVAFTGIVFILASLLNGFPTDSPYRKKE